MIACIVICFFSGWSVFLKGNWSTETFITNYLPFALFPILYISARIFFKYAPKSVSPCTRFPVLTPLSLSRSRFISPMDMDFVSGLEQIEAESYDDPPPKNKVEAVWQWLVCVPNLIDNDSALTRFYRCKRHGV
jgi:yeast amino acid transporter